MTDIIEFPQRMRFTALRTYQHRRGLGGVVAVFFTPQAINAHRTAAPSNGEADQIAFGKPAGPPIHRM